MIRFYNNSSVSGRVRGHSSIMKDE